MRYATRQPSFLKFAAAMFAIAMLTLSTIPGPVAAQSSEPDGPPLIEPILVDDLPAHIKLLIAGAAMRLQGSDRASFGPVFFSPEALRGLAETDFDYRGFSLSGVVLGQADELSEDGKALDLNTMILWQDALGRRAATSLALRYVLRAGSLEVTGGHVVPVSAGIPDVRLFALPITNDGADLDGFLTDFGRLMGLLNRKGINPSSLAGTDSHYILFAVAADRLPASARVRFVPSGSRSDRSTDGPDGVVISIEGWRVGMIPVLAGEVPPRLLKVYYRPSPILSGEAAPRERLAAIFLLSEEPLASEPNSARAPTLAEPITGSAAIAAPLLPRQSGGANNPQGAKPKNTFRNLMTQ